MNCNLGNWKIIIISISYCFMSVIMVDSSEIQSVCKPNCFLNVIFKLYDANVLNLSQRVQGYTFVHWYIFL